MDVRSPLVFSTHELGRRPGAMRTERRTVPAPADLGTEVVRVPEGADVDLDLRMEAVMDGVLVTGTAAARTHAECVRCLMEVEDDVDVDLSELFAYEGTREALLEAGDEEAEEQHVVQDEHLDLEPVLRDALVPALPFQPLCDPDCGGLCSICGERMDDLEPGHAHEQLDPRWSALTALLEDGDDEAGTRR